MTICTRLIFALALAVIATLCSASASAQELATLGGRVTDPHGLPVAGVKVQAVNVDTNVAYSTETNDVGLYNISALPSGTYRVIVEKQGFVQIIKPGVQLHVADIVAVNFGLQIGSITQSVTIEAGAPLVNTESAAVSTVIDRQFVENLPLNGRSFNTLLQLTPGVVIAPTSNVSQGQFSIAGQRTSSNNFLVDGVSANFGVSTQATLGTSGTGSAQAFSAIGGTSSLVSVEALQEFRVETSSFAPEFGRAPGGQVILNTRAGSNAFHGGIYEYFRNDVMDANDWFNKAVTPEIPRAPERHNDFGGFLGGPIWKDKTFFFASYEGARLRQPTTQLVTVPYTAVSPCLAPAAIVPFLDPFPKPNGTVSTATCTGQFTGSSSNPFTLDAGSIRLDHTFNSRFSVFARYNEAPSVLAARNGSMVTAVDVGTRTVTLGGTVAINPQIANAVRVNYSFQRASSVINMDSFGGAVPPDLTVLAPNLPNLSNTAVAFGTFDTATLAVGPIAHNRSTQLNFADDLTLSRGAHQLKFGGDYRAIYTDLIPQGSSLSYFISTVSNFLATESADFGIFAGSNKPSYLLTRAFSLYGQDTWKATPRLAVTFGLRWEVNPAPSGRRGTTLPAWDNIKTPSQLVLAPSGTELWSTTYTDFAPRLGIAYKLTRAGDLVLRAGWGIFYDLASDSVGNFAGDFPNSAFEVSPPATLPLADAAPYIPGLSSQPPYPSITQGFMRNLKLPRSYQWNAALERSFGGHQSISLTYAGQAGRDFLRQEGISSPNANFPPPDVFYLTKNNAFSNYDALQIQYRRSLSAGLQALLNYTWSHTLDNASNDTVTLLSGAVISAANDYASSDFDVRHSFSGGLTYSIPAAAREGALERLTGGWSIDAVIVARSGFPFNGVASLAGQVSGAAIRPDLVPGKPFWIANPAAGGGKSLNPDAFQTPAPGMQGTEGRNDIPGFGLTQVDLSFGRRFALTERFNLQFRTDAFNVFNHPNFANPRALIGVGDTFLKSSAMLNNGLSQGGGLNPLFQEGGPRSLQLSLKLTF